MALIVPVDGEIELLKRSLQLNDAITGDVKIGLFSGNYTITDTTTLADLLAEEIATEGSSSDEGSYARIIIDPASDWSVANESGAGVATGSEKTFSLDGGADGYTVYGYFVMIEGTGGDVGTNEILWAENFPTPFNIAASGGEVRVISKLELE